MKIFTFTKKDFAQYLAVSASLSVGILLILFSDAVKEEIIVTVKNCITVVIPCIFPMLCIGNFITEYGFPLRLKAFVGKITEKLFGLSGNCCEAVFLGLTSGYIAASRSAAALREKNIITKEESERLILFFTNPGISFTVLVFGKVIYNSVYFGIVIYLLSIGINIISAVIYNLINKNRLQSCISENNGCAVNSFISSVKNSSEAVISISFYMIVFTCISTLFTLLFPFKAAEYFVKISGEVTAACFYGAAHFPVSLVYFSLQTGGFCIFLQLLPDLKKAEISSLKFLFTRFILSFVGSLAVRTFFYEHEIIASVFSYSTEVKLSSGSLTGTFSLLLLCLIYLFSVKTTLSSITVRQ